MNDAHLAKQIPDNGFLHFLRLIFLYLVLSAAVLFFGLGLFFWAAILRSTGGRARDQFLLLIPGVGFYVGTRALWRYTAKNHYWKDRSDLNAHPFFGPGRTFARQPSPVYRQDSQDNESPSERTPSIQSDEMGANDAEERPSRVEEGGIEPAALDSDEIRALRNQIAAAEKEQKVSLELERLKKEAAAAKESVTKVSLDLAAAESELRILRLRDEDQLEGDERIEFLKSQLAALEEIELLKNELRLFEARVEKAEAAYQSALPTGGKSTEVSSATPQVDYSFLKDRPRQIDPLSPAEKKEKPVYRQDWRDVELAYRVRHGLEKNKEEKLDSTDDASLTTSGTSSTRDVVPKRMTKKELKAARRNLKESQLQRSAEVERRRASGDED
tara:strand:+ start:110 stop:1267 length:1158 start_codon:yes stop_codon:yes gene_type:complete